MNTDTSAQTEMDEVSMKELILIVQKYFRELLANWKLIGLIIIPCLAYFLYTALTTPDDYPANITFMVDEEEGGGGSNVGALLGQFGFSTGGGSYNIDKIQELSKTMRIIKGALFEKGEVRGEKDFFANHIIKEYDLRDKWAENNPQLADFAFTNGNFEKFSRIENKALKSVYSKVRGNKEEGIEGLMDINYGEETTILRMSVKSTSEELSIQFLNTLYEKLSGYYIEESTKKSIYTRDNLQAKVDSIGGVLESTEYQLAKAMDKNLGLVSRSAELRQNRLERELRVIAPAYAQALENLEVADFGVMNATPFFEVIDPPLAPLKPIKESWLKAIIMGLLLGGFIGGLIVIVRKVYRDTMNET